MLLPHEVRRFRACHLRGGVLNVVAYLLLLYSIAGARGALAQGLAEGAQIHIGVSLPLTGDLQEYGHAVAHGIELAREKFPQWVRLGSDIWRIILFCASSTQR